MGLKGLFLLLSLSFCFFSHSFGSVNDMKWVGTMGENKQTFLTSTDMVMKTKLTKGLKISSDWVFNNNAMHMSAGLAFSQSISEGASTILPNRSQKVTVLEQRIDVGLVKKQTINFAEKINIVSAVSYVYGGGVLLGRYSLKDTYQHISDKKINIAPFLITSAELSFKKNQQWTLNTSVAYRFQKVSFQDGYSIDYGVDVGVGIGYRF